MENFDKHFKVGNADFFEFIMKLAWYFKIIIEINTNQDASKFKKI